jgi:hypothetical protein
MGPQLASSQIASTDRAPFAHVTEAHRRNLVAVVDAWQKRSAVLGRSADRRGTIGGKLEKSHDLERCLPGDPLRHLQEDSAIALILRTEAPRSA